jgi:xylan 1,4-beta-xylosidase
MLSEVGDGIIDSVQSVADFASIDPRWGRGQETPGEDVLRVSNYVRSYVPGLQGDNPLDKQVISTCKHYAVYDLETGRYGNDYNPSQQDMADYFLSSFKACVRDVNVGSVMCSYNAVCARRKVGSGR